MPTPWNPDISASDIIANIREELVHPCQHLYIDAKNYPEGNVECARCGALWLQWSPVRDTAPELLAALEQMATLAETVAVNEPSVRAFDWENVHAGLRAAIAKANVCGSGLKGNTP